jgi:hypothetical protein
MSTGALVVAFHHSRATGTAKLALICLANYGDGERSAVRMTTIAKFCNAPVPEAQDALDHLESLGEIEQLSLPLDDDEMREFRFLLDCPPNCLNDPAHTVTQPTSVPNEGGVVA